MIQYQMDIASEEEIHQICSGLISFNAAAVPFLREQAFVPVNRVIRDETGRSAA